MKIKKHVRSQHSRGGGSTGFGGPDTYVAVTIAPDNVTTPYTLRGDVLKKRGIKIIHCGEGYYTRQATTRSMLGGAHALANKIVSVATQADKLGIL